MVAKIFGSSPSGRYSAGGVKKAIISTLAVTVTAMTTIRRTGPAINQAMLASVARRNGPSPLTVVAVSGSILALAVGTAVMAINIEASMDAETAMAMSE